MEKLPTGNVLCIKCVTSQVMSEIFRSDRYRSIQQCMKGLKADCMLNSRARKSDL